MLQGLRVQAIAKRLPDNMDLRDAADHPNKHVEMSEVSEKTAREIEERFVESLRPYWTGGRKNKEAKKPVTHNFRKWSQREESGWLSAIIGRPGGIHRSNTDYYRAGDARFSRRVRCFPEYRGKGYGARYS